MTLAEVVRAASEYLAEKGVASPRVDAEHLVAKALGLTRLDLYLHHDRPLTVGEVEACRALVRQRGRREPLAYILGEWGFRRLTLSVDRRVLIPRPETEVVVERCLALLDGREEPEALDVGTGSGAIALALADEHPTVRVTAVDASLEALSLAGENARRAGLSGRVRFLRQDLFSGLPPGPFDLVVSNPPYVEPDELPSLQPEVREWEPQQALVGPGATEAVAAGARQVLRPGGWLVLEVADGRAEEVASLLARLGYQEVRRSLDLAGRERVVEARWTR